MPSRSINEKAFYPGHKETLSLVVFRKFGGSHWNRAFSGWSYNQFHNILRLSDVYQIFLSPQVKRWAIITYKHRIYELPHGLTNGLRLRILWKIGNIRKVFKLHRIRMQCPLPHAKMKALLILEESFWKTEIKLFPLCVISHEN